MKKVYLTVVLFLLAGSMYAQENENNADTDVTEESNEEDTEGKVREAGVIMNSFNNFGLTYKCGTATQLWRFQTANFSFASGTERNSFGIGFKAGHEWRKSLAENFELKYGADLVFNYNITGDKDDDGEVTNRNRMLAPGIGGVIGVNYICKENLVITASLLPTLSIQGRKITSGVNTTETTSTTRNDVNFNLSSSSAYLTVAYRF